MTQTHTSITVETDPRRPLVNRHRIEVIGTRGEFYGTRKGYAEALTTAVHYARLLGAPHAVLAEGR